MKTRKGTGTNGYIQINSLYKQIQRKEKEKEIVYQKPKKKYHYVDKNILEHELQRKIEIQLLEWIKKNASSLSDDKKILLLHQKRKEIYKNYNQQNEKKILQLNEILLHFSSLIMSSDYNTSVNQSEKIEKIEKSEKIDDNEK